MKSFIKITKEEYRRVSDRGIMCILHYRIQVNRFDYTMRDVFRTEKARDIFKTFDRCDVATVYLKEGETYDKKTGEAKAKRKALAVAHKRFYHDTDRLQSWLIGCANDFFLLNEEHEHRAQVLLEKVKQ